MKLIITEKETTSNVIKNALDYNSFRFIPFGDSCDHVAAENSNYIIFVLGIVDFKIEPHDYEIQATENFFSSIPMTDGFCPDRLKFYPENLNIDPIYRISADVSKDLHSKQLELLRQLMNRADVDEVIYMHAGTIDPEHEVAIRIILHDVKCAKPVTRCFFTDSDPQSIRAALADRKPLNHFDDLARKGFYNMFCRYLERQDAGMSLLKTCFIIMIITCGLIAFLFSYEEILTYISPIYSYFDSKGILR